MKDKESLEIYQSFLKNYRNNSGEVWARGMGIPLGIHNSEAVKKLEDIGNIMINKEINCFYFTEDGINRIADYLKEGILK